MSHLDIIHFGRYSQRLHWVRGSGPIGLSSETVEPIWDVKLYDWLKESRLGYVTLVLETSFCMS
jgi:hypothetical protein